MRSRAVVVALAVAAAGTLPFACGKGTGNATPPGDLPDTSSTDAMAPSVDAPPATDAPADTSAPLVDTCGSVTTGAGDVWLADPRLCLSVYAEKITLAREMAFAPNGDLLVESSGSIVVNADRDRNGVIDSSESTTYVAGGLSLNHGLAISPDGHFVYASSDSTIYRWSYQSGDLTARGDAEVVVHDIPAGGHSSRTLVFDAAGRLYVNVGSVADVDEEADLVLRSQIRRFVVPAALATGGLDYTSGENVASGLRNEVGLAFDSKGRFWGVENGSDGEYLPLAATGEPAEEINRLDVSASPGHFFGFSRCWTEFGFDGGLGRGAQWAYLGPASTTDAWCRDAGNQQPPVASMRPHWAPLGVTEYTGSSLPWRGDLFVAAHGSMLGRVPMVGRLLARAHVVGDQITDITPVAGHLVDGGLEEGTWSARPVDVRNGPDGALYFSDDEGGRIFRLGYRP